MTDVHAPGGDGPRPIATDIDLSRVDPRRWAETRRRVGVITAWTAKARHTRGECERAAASLGLTPKHFMRLVAAWKKHRDASRIDGLGFRRGVQQPARHLQTGTRAIVEAVIDELGAGTPSGEVEAEVQRRCAATDVAPPSTGMVHNLLMRARQRDRAGAAPPGILVGRISCILPTMAEDGTAARCVTVVVAVRVPGAAITAHRVVWEEERLGAAADHVLADITATGASVPITLARSLADTATQVADRTGTGVVVAAGSEILAAVLGSWLGGIPIRHRRRSRPNAANVPAIDAPLSREDAETAIRLAIEVHNGGADAAS